MSVLQREVDAYQRALDAYRRKFSSATLDQNRALQALQQGTHYRIPTDTPGQYVIATGVDDKGNFQLAKRKTGGFLGIGRQEVPITVGEDALQPKLPLGPTEEAIGVAPKKPDTSLSHLDRPSLAAGEAGLISEVLRGQGVLQNSSWFAPKSLAAEMAKRAEAAKAQAAETNTYYDTPGP